METVKPSNREVMRFMLRGLYRRHRVVQESSFILGITIIDTHRGNSFLFSFQFFTRLGSVFLRRFKHDYCCSFAGGTLALPAVTRIDRDA